VSCDWKASDFDDETRDFGAESGSGLGEAGDWEEQEGGKEAGSELRDQTISVAVAEEERMMRQIH
jgi:hypothetical protein